MSTYKMNCHHPSNMVNQTILACGSGTGVVLPDHNERNAQLFNPYVVASVSIDTSMLVRPTIKVDFSALITYKESGYCPSDLRLTFQLVKVCDNGAKIPLGTWNYERFLDISSLCIAGVQTDNAIGGGFIDFETVDSFAFTFCECHDCPGCCHYMVEIVNAETNNVDHPAISNGSITALAVGPLAFFNDRD
ncbi:MAG: DUF4489 domain-containing protein [Syntrophomonadaceae bacterium]|jgi:hypothetical protein